MNSNLSWHFSQDSHGPSRAPGRKAKLPLYEYQVLMMKKLQKETAALHRLTKGIDLAASTKQALWTVDRIRM